MNLPRKNDVFKHLKTGKIYRIMGVDNHTETMEELVVYSRDEKIWIRPLKMFMDGRFERVMQ